MLKVTGHSEVVVFNEGDFPHWDNALTRKYKVTWLCIPVALSGFYMDKCLRINAMDNS